MQLHNDSGVRTFVAGEDLTENLLVYLSAANEVSICGASDQPIGVARTTVASGDLVGVFLLSKQGTITCTAGAAITVNAPVMPIAGGKVDDLAAGKPIGVALQAASGDGVLVEVLPLAIDTIP